MRYATYRWAMAPVTLIGLIHIVGGICVMAEPLAANVSGLAGLRALPAPFLGQLLIAVGVMAIASRLASFSAKQQYLLVLPQQLVLLVQLAGIWVTLYLGKYPDGYVPGQGEWQAFWFILSDQLPWIGLSLSHLVDMLITPTIDPPSDEP